MVVKPRLHQVIHHDVKRTGYEDPPLVKAHVVMLKMKLVENWMPLKEIQALIPGKNGKQRIIGRRKECYERERKRASRIFLLLLN